MQYEIDKIKNTILCGNVLDELRKFPNDCIDCIITSPPYWGLRDYGEDTKVKWQDGWYGQLGLEPTLDLYIEHLLQITAELKRVLKKSGVMFWDHGDCYCSQPAGNTFENYKEWEKKGDGLIGRLAKRNTNEYKDLHRFDKNKYGGKSGIHCGRGRGLTPYQEKCMWLQNWRLILKMIDEQGWVLRNTIIWHKPNAMPSSVNDRFANKYEPVFFLTKNRRYFFDLDVVRQPLKQTSTERLRRGVSDHHKYINGAPGQTPQGIFKPRPNINKFNYRVRDAEKKSEQCPQFKATKEEIERYKKRQTSIPEDQAESFGSPRARYWRKYDIEKEQKEAIEKEGKIGSAQRVESFFDKYGGKTHPLGKNPGDVWAITTQPCPKEYRGKHFAMFPEKLVEPMILAGCPAQICKKCGKARERIINKKELSSEEWTEEMKEKLKKAGANKEGQYNGKATAEYPDYIGNPSDRKRRILKAMRSRKKTIGWTKCQCENPEYEAGIVLDPFCGLATTCVVVKRLHRNYIGIEISKEYAKLAEKRIKDTPAPLL